ncbi:MAG: succinate dehydrogenase, cytochrome b556 subunit [Asticcacaulis sp. 32-58-5]|nr:MAG: succinate dehydrogenase, cytochrome b556 subunit [Asticcacaulis sp. 32-58-5]
MTQPHTPPKAAYRPLSPHLQIWRFHMTMFSSIVHRITGVATIAGLLMGVAWLWALAMGPQAYTCFLGFAASPFGLLVWFGVSLAGFVHLTGGIRHLIWDMGYMFEPKKADTLATITFWGAIILTVILWAVLFSTGKVQVML